MQLRLMVNGRVLTALIMLAIFLAATGMAFGFPEKARLMPLMVGVPGSLLALIQVFIEMRKAAHELAERERVEAPEERDAAEREEKLAEANMFLWMFLFFIGILCFGFVYAAPVLVFGFLLAMSQLVVAQLYLGQISPHRRLCHERQSLSLPHFATRPDDTQPAASTTQLFPTGRYGRGGHAARRALSHLLSALPGIAAQAVGLKPQSAALPLRPMQTYLQSVDRNTAGPPA